MRRIIHQLSYTILLTLLLQSFATAQKTRLLSGIVIDAHDNKPVEHAEVRSNIYSKKTNSAGRFEFEISRGEPVLISHRDFQTRRIYYKDLRGLDHVTIYISHKSKGINNTLQASKSEIVHKGDFESVQDFVFLGDTLVVMTYMESKPKNYEAEVRNFHNSLNFFLYGVLIRRVVLPDNAVTLYKDAFRRLFVSGNGFCLQVLNTIDGTALKEIDPDYFEDHIRTATVAVSSESFFGTTLSPIPELTHYVVYADKDSILPIRNIRNKKYFDNIPGDYRSLSDWQMLDAVELESKYGIDQAKFAPMIKVHESNGYYDFPYAPAYGDGAKVFIFDHLNGMIFHHRIDGTPTDSVSMYHHHFDGENYKGMIQDELSRKCYAVHEKSGAVYIREVIPLTGAARRPVKLRNPFPKSVRIYGGWVYYAHRLPGTGEPYNLYREKLPY